MSDPKFRLYTAQDVAEWLLAEQAHRYRQDLSRLGDERDEAVAQHDRDAETIGELRGKITTWGNLYEATKQRVTEYAGYLKLAEGVAAALPDPDALEVVELPEPDAHGGWVAGDSHCSATIGREVRLDISEDGPLLYITPAEARNLASRSSSAARHAGEGTP